MLTAIVLITTDPGRIPEVAELITNLKSVTDCYSVAGEFDLVAIVKVVDHEELADAIADGISKIPGVARTQTLIAFRSYSKVDLDQAFALGIE
jgi:DNA-binding Lrp family transcriptional regulator